MDMYIYIYVYISRMYKNRNGTSEGALIWNGTASQANRSGLDQNGCGLERHGTAFRGAVADLDQTGPDWTGPDQTGPDLTGPDRTRLDRTGLDRHAA